jgi:hypothetical protein
VKQPIACSLDAPDAASQIDEWRQVLDALVTAVEWVDPTCVRMPLQGDADTVATLVALAQREAACCPFFRFSIEIDPDGLVFTASVPPDATPILEQFAGLAAR